MAVLPLGCTVAGSNLVPIDPPSDAVKVGSLSIDAAEGPEVAAPSAPCNNNGCGGCTPLVATPGAPCGACGRYACAGADGVACVDSVCTGKTPVCLASTCVECLPASQRCGGSMELETCDAGGVWAAAGSCLPPSVCHENARRAACLGVALVEPANGASKPPLIPFPFRWTIRDKLDGVRYCNVLVLDKGQTPRDGFGEDAFYAGEGLDAAPALDPLFYGGTTFAWAVLTVACKDADAVCQRPCGSSRDCARQGVLPNLPCDGTPAWSETRSLSVAP